MFSDPKKRALLNKITHWRIFREIFMAIFKNKILKGLSKVVLDAPLLFETKILEHICHPIICVYISNEESQIQRLMTRNNFSREECLKRINSQFPISAKI